MVPLIDVLDTDELALESDPPGRYDANRRLRVDDQGAATVTSALGGLSTETRGGADRDDAPSGDVRSLATVTKAQTDRDEPSATLLGTKTGAGRDTDGPELASPLFDTVTFAGPDRD